jgi:hypothetical protein
MKHAMGGICNTHGGMRNAYTNLVGESHLGDTGVDCNKSNIKIKFGET